MYCSDKLCFALINITVMVDWALKTQAGYGLQRSFSRKIQITKKKKKKKMKQKERARLSSFEHLIHRKAFHLNGSRIL